MLSLFFLMIAFFCFFNIQNNGVWTLDPNFVQIKKVLRSIVYFQKNVLRYSVWPAKVIRTLWRERERYGVLVFGFVEIWRNWGHVLPTPYLQFWRMAVLSLSLLVSYYCHLLFALSQFLLFSQQITFNP